MPRDTLISLFAEFSRYARDVAVVQRRGYRREVWTYGKLAGAALACAHELRERGVHTGDRVLLWGPNSAEWMAAFWGCLLRGVVAVPLDDGSSHRFASDVSRETSATLMFAATDKPALDPAIPTLKLEGLPDILGRPRVFDTVHYLGEPRKLLHQSIVDEPLADEPLTRNHIAQILFTSGTTAEPRGVVLTHGNFLANLEPLERGLDPYRKYERWFHPLRFVSLVPLSHVFGQFMTLFVPPLLGATVIFEPSTNAPVIQRAIKRERATALIAVPHMLDLLRNSVTCALEARGRLDSFKNAFEKAAGKKFLRRAWMFRRIHQRWGWKFWAFISGGAALAEERKAFFRGLAWALIHGSRWP